MTRKGRRMDRVPLAYRDTTVALVASRTTRRVCRSGGARRRPSRWSACPRSSTARCPAARARARSSCATAAGVVDRVALLTAEPVAAATVIERLDDTVPGGVAALGIVLGLLGWAPSSFWGSAPAPSARGPPLPPLVPPPTGDRRRMIITVTLNAAIDKSLSVPNFRLGRRHRTVEQMTMPEQGRQRRAHPQDPRGARDRHRPGRRPHRHPHRRTAHPGVHPQRLRAHRRGFAHQHGGVRPDQRPADGRSTSAVRAVTAQEVELFRDKLLYLAAARTWSSSPGRCPCGIDASIYAEPSATCADGVATVIDTDGDPSPRHAAGPSPT